MSPRPFTGSFTQQEPIPEEAIDAAVDVLRSGRLHRYNLGPGEPGQTALLEAEFADWQGASFCLAVTSGGAAMQLALRGAGVAPGAVVLTNAFTLAPVPGAIHAVGAVPVLVEIGSDLTIDLDDLDAKAAAHPGAVLLLSLMRGHLPDMDALCAMVARHDLTLIEDCAHTMGAAWAGRRSGSFGLAGCFSTQTYKHLNSGEGGFLTSDDPEFMARVTVASGSYMLYGRHGAGPGSEDFETARLEMPNCSARMDHLRAAILRPQLFGIEDAIARWNTRYRLLDALLREAPGLVLRTRPEQERYVGSSIQFRMPGLTAEGCNEVVADCAALGVELKWFGAADPHGFTSTHRSWAYAPAQDLPRTDRVLATLFDMRIPLTFSEADCAQIAEIIIHVARTRADTAEALT